MKLKKNKVNFTNYQIYNFQEYIIILTLIIIIQLLIMIINLKFSLQLRE